jgi:hypothetical protein
MSRTPSSSQTRAGMTGSRQSADAMQPSQDLLDYLKEYAKEKPEVAALWCFGVGFILGWKLKPW